MSDKKIQNQKSKLTPAQYNKFIDQTYQKIWQLAKPYLKKGKMKNFVIHTE